MSAAAGLDAAPGLLLAAGAIGACLAWWASTALLLWIVHRSRLPRSLVLMSAAALAGAAMLGILASSASTSLAAICCAFACALVVWAFAELTFLLGWITGPSRAPAIAGCRPAERFARAARTVLWHELLLVALGICLWMLVAGGGHALGAWTFTALWAMRLSAKLNLFLGVRTTGRELLRADLAYLGTHFGARSVNAIWPFSMLAMLAGGIALFARGADASAEVALCSGLLGMLVMLGALEHALLIAPWQSDKLWSWSGAVRRIR